VAFDGPRRIAAGALVDVALAVKSAIEADSTRSILVFDGQSGRPVDLDLRGGPDEIVARLAPPPEPPRRPGRPRLGVVAREVTLLPRHWEWLARQPGGASVALRKLVEAASRANEAPDRVRAAHEAAYRFMTAVAGDYPGYEDACRALFSGDQGEFETCIAPWPADVRDQALAFAYPRT
jgi:hypothetical protein